MSPFQPFREGRIISLGIEVGSASTGGTALDRCRGWPGGCARPRWLLFSPAQSRAPVACCGCGLPLGVARAGRGSPRAVSAPGL